MRKILPSTFLLITFFAQVKKFDKMHHWIPHKILAQKKTILWTSLNFFEVSQNFRQYSTGLRVFQENKVRQIFRKTNISYPMILTRGCAYQGVRNVSFSENLESVTNEWYLSVVTYKGRVKASQKEIPDVTKSPILTN